VLGAYLEVRRAQAGGQQAEEVVLYLHQLLAAAQLQDFLQLVQEQHLQCGTVQLYVNNTLAM
jgi:hypothetical protein